MQFLLAILLINAFVLMLCTLLSLAGRFLRQSGQATMQINGQAQSVECGQKLIDSMAQNGIFLPAACGGKGTCGRCQVVVDNGGGNLTTLERLHLKPEEIAALARLACQVKVRENIEVRVANALLAAGLFKARLLNSQKVSADIKTLSFELEADKSLEFMPGQYLQVVYQQPWERVTRAYSISSSPEHRQGFSLDVQRIDGGLVSNFLHELQPGESIEVTGPFGDMALCAADLQRPLILVAGGVGLAPLRSMVAQLQKNGFAAPVMLFHGARSRENLYCEEEFRSLSRSYGNFHYFPALSQPLLEDGWEGARGMIHQVLERELQRQHSAANELKAFICGPTPMMLAVTKILVAAGLPSDRIFTDPFDF